MKIPEKVNNICEMNKCQRFSINVLKLQSLLGRDLKVTRERVSSRKEQSPGRTLLHSYALGTHRCVLIVIDEIPKMKAGELAARAHLQDRNSCSAVYSRVLESDLSGFSP